MNVSPYLSAIQALKGETPGEKHKDLHSIAAKIIEDIEEKEKFIKTGSTDRVASALLPNLRILVGLKLRSKEAVVEALKSDDVTIIKLALGAKWFFRPTNDLINVDFFVEKLLPFVSVRTRLELIKALANCLEAKTGESFHSKFAGLFGTDQALPLLIACGEAYIYDEILKRKIILSSRMLKQLYRKYPQLTIRYLRLIKDDVATNWDKHVRSYGLEDCQSILPSLLKNHTQEFLEFYLNIPIHCRRLTFGRTRAKFFIKNSTDAIVKNPRDFLNVLPLKLIKSKLRKQQYDTMLQNLFPETLNELSVPEMVDFIQKFYPNEKGFELFREKYKKAYNKDMLEHTRFFGYEVVYEVLPEKIKTEYSRIYVNSLADKSEYWRRVYQLPPKEAIPLLKEHIKKSSVLPREECLKYMIKSCNLYKSKEDLLEVLQYFNSRHKNEQAPVLLQFLDCLSRTFDNMDSLDNEHWQVIKDIVQRAYVKGDLFTTTYYIDPERVFRPILRYFLKQCKMETAQVSDKTFLEKIVNVILKYYCENNRKWNFLSCDREVEDICLEKFLTVVPQKYPESHDTWKKDNNKLKLTSYFIETMGKFNKTLQASRADKFSIESYTWLVKFTTDLLINEEDNCSSSKTYTDFKKTLQKFFAEFYQKLIDEHVNMVNDVTTNDALIILKRDRSKILNKVNEYLSECKNMLQRGRKSTRRFVMSLKWYQDIPLKFIEKCLEETEQKDSVFILGILLEGEALSKIIEPYLPKESKLDVESDTAKKDYELMSAFPRALNYTNPLPPLEVLLSLCKKGYLSLALQCLRSIAQRVPIDRVIAFANNFTNDAISVRKASIRLIIQVAPKPQACDFLLKICKEEKNPGIREVLAKIVYDLFIQTPSEYTWRLMKEFIHDLLADDKHIFSVIKNLEFVDEDYATDYIIEIFKVIDSFNDEELNALETSQFISAFLYAIGERQILHKLPEDFITKIIKKFFFGCHLKFTFEMYLFSDETKFENRLKVIMSILSENLTQLYVPDSNRPRIYPTLMKIHYIFSRNEIFDQLKNNGNREMKGRFIASVLENTLVQQNLKCFTKFNIYRILLNESDPKSFGEKCGRNIDDLIKLYNTELIIEYYGNNLRYIVQNSFSYEQLFDIVDGLTSYKFNYGVFISLKLLTIWQVDTYDERYDKFVEAVKNSDDVMIRAELNNYLFELY